MKQLSAISFQLSAIFVKRQSSDLKLLVSPKA